MFTLNFYTSGHPGDPWKILKFLLGDQQNWLRKGQDLRDPSENPLDFFNEQKWAITSGYTSLRSVTIRCDRLVVEIAIVSASF